MAYIKHKVLTGFPCNNGKFYIVITEDLGNLTTTNKEEFDKVMKDGFIELKHKDEK